MRALYRFLLLLPTLGVAATVPPLAVAASENLAAGRLTFIKTFKGSVPEYMRVSVQGNGEALFEGRLEDEQSEAESFRLSADVTSRLFTLAAELNYFRGLELESGQKIAYMGKKTFIYEKEGQKTEVSYNYTRDHRANELQRWFENIARGRFLIRQLTFHVHYDRLGVLEAVREFERDFNAGRLVDWEQFVPILERIASDGGLMRLARRRARELLRRIQGAPGRLRYEYVDQDSGWYYKVTLEQQGSAIYESRRLSQPPNPKPLELPETAARRLWELVRQSNYFRGFSSGQPTGQISGHRLVYEGGAEHNAVGFSTPPDAFLAEMLHIFRQAIRQERFRKRLQTALERGGTELQVALQELEDALLQDGLVDPNEFAPMLEGIANGTAHHPLVREQAQRLLVRLPRTD